MKKYGFIIPILYLFFTIQTAYATSNTADFTTAGSHSLTIGAWVTESNYKMVGWNSNQCEVTASNGLSCATNQYAGFQFLSGFSDDDVITKIRVNVKQVGSSPSFTFPSGNSSSVTTINSGIVTGWNEYNAPANFTAWRYGTRKDYYLITTSPNQYVSWRTAGGSTSFQVYAVEFSTTESSLNSEIEFIPDVNETNSTSIYISGYVSSEDDPFIVGQLHYVVTGCHPVNSSYSHCSDTEPLLWHNINQSESFNHSVPIFSRETRYHGYILDDLNAPMWEDYIIYDPEYIPPPPPEAPPNLTIPDFTPLPWPTFTQGDQNITINGTNFSNMGNTLRNQTGQLLNGTNSAWGMSDNIIGQMRSHVLDAKARLEAVDFSTENSILALCPCVLSSIHYKVKNVFIYALTLMTILIIMGRR